MSRLVCPRISPEWELAAQLALVKPKPYTKEKIAHRNPQQPWPRNARKIVAECCNDAVAVDFPKYGDHRMIAEFGEMDAARAKGLARKLSRALPELWFILDNQTYLRAGVVYQRTGRYNLELVRADRMRLRRAVRFGFLDEVDHHAIPRPDHRARQNAAAQRDR
jgi:hypothetical protein